MLHNAAHTAGYCVCVNWKDAKAAIEMRTPERRRNIGMKAKLARPYDEQVVVG
jgi:hypothetical protein